MIPELTVDHDEKEEMNFSENVEFDNFLALSLLLNNCLYLEGYRPPKEIEEHIKLTKYGEKWRDIVSDKFRNITNEEIKLALLVVGYHNDILIDFEKTNIEGIFRVIDSDIFERKIIYPWLFDTELYIKFNNTYSEKPEKLDYSQTFNLLNETSKGVFQVKNFLVGPFGFLISEQQRILRPSVTAPLWYCEDPTCNSAHVVKFSSGTCLVENVIDFLQENMRTFEGDLTDTKINNLKQLIRKTIAYHEDMHLEDLPWLLANSFHEIELKIILSELFKRYSKKIRGKLQKWQTDSERWRNSNEQVISTLSKSECLQLILLLGDNEITETIEFLIEGNKITIPSTEIRGSSPRRITYGWLELICECSDKGIRSVDKRNINQIAFSRIKYLIRNIYLQEPSILEWKLRSIKGSNTDTKLDRYLIEKDPSIVVRELILDSREHTEKCFSYLRFGYFYYPSNEDEDERIIKKILWKLGFNQMSFPKSQSLFWDRLKRFKEVASSVTSRNENDKETIRSEAINFFVSLEEILENALSFTSWMLFSDHFSKTHFSYSFEDGLNIMVEKLNGAIFGDNEKLELNPKGKNTLFPLITGFGILAKLCESVMSERDKYVKPFENLPHYSRNSELIEFPFRHNIHLLNVNLEDIQKIITLLKNTTIVLETNQVCSIRNRIKHNRIDFPSTEEIVSCCNSIDDIINQLEIYGLYPSISNFKRKISDQYDRKISTYLDYRDREINIIRSGRYTPFTLPNDTQFLIIVPALHIGTTTEFLRFRIIEASPYMEVWKGHPAKRL